MAKRIERLIVTTCNDRTWVTVWTHTNNRRFYPIITDSTPQRIREFALSRRVTPFIYSNSLSIHIVNESG